MVLHHKVVNWLLRWALGVIGSRPPDVIIDRDPLRGMYLQRWYIIPRNPVLNVYLHVFKTSDVDTETHDHPWPNMSILLNKGYWEYVGRSYQEPLERHLRLWGSIVFRRAETAHRIELFREPDFVVTLFLTGPRVREWGFWTRKGWIQWEQFIKEKG